MAREDANIATNTRTHCHAGTRTTTPACMSRRITNRAIGAMKYANRVGFSAARGRRSSLPPVWSAIDQGLPALAPPRMVLVSDIQGPGFRAAFFRLVG
jgi:hypothetical protein